MKEIDELVSEWKPEPLVDPPLRSTQELSRPPIIIGPPTVKPKIIYGEAAERFTSSSENEDGIDPSDIKEVTNLASVNFAGLIGNEQIKLKAIEQLRRSGVGSCGPPGFYGTFGKFSQNSFSILISFITLLCAPPSAPIPFER